MDKDKKPFNRHERIAHFYRGSLNDQKQTVLEALDFNDYSEALIWLAHEFSTRDLNWNTTKDEEVHCFNSPYPQGLPNVVRISEEGSKMTLEEVLEHIWSSLILDEKALVNQNYKNVFGFPSLVQGENTRYCKEKYKKWIEMKLD